MEESSAAEEFFAQGDAGLYEGGPAHPSANDAIEVEVATVPMAARLAQADRRDRYTRIVKRVVAGLGVFCLAALAYRFAKTDETSGSSDSSSATMQLIALDPPNRAERVSSDFDTVEGERRKEADKSEPDESEASRTSTVPQISSQRVLAARDQRAPKDRHVVEKTAAPTSTAAAEPTEERASPGVSAAQPRAFSNDAPTASATSSFPLLPPNLEAKGEPAPAGGAHEPPTARFAD